MIRQDLCSRAGIRMGAVALLLAFTHFMFGPFSSKTSLENLIATQIVAIRHTAMTALKGEEVISMPAPLSLNSDHLLKAVIAVLACGAIIMGTFGWVIGKDNSHIAMTAISLGVATIALQFAVAVLGIILLLVLIGCAVCILSG